MDRTAARELWLVVGGAAGLMLASNALVRVASVSMPKVVGSLWVMGMLVDVASLTILTWSILRQRTHPGEALVAFPVLGWCCYVVSACLWPAPLFLPLSPTAIGGVELCKLLELALLTGLHAVTQFTVPARLLEAVAPAG